MSEAALRKPHPSSFLAHHDCRPFVKWVGGKSQILSALGRRIPENFERYYEPFIGGGALFFHLQPSHASLSDINPELINAYLVVQNEVEALIKALKRHRYDREYYYKVRNADRTARYLRWSEVARAARLIYLNKSCFNGLYRVNSKGQFNTPFGRYTNPTIVDQENLRACNAALQGAKITLASFSAISDEISPADFVYFDPPYVPLTATSFFTNYSADGFGLGMQQSLRNLCRRLDKRGVRFMLSNSSAPLVRELYREFRIENVLARRALNAKASARGQIQEVVVTNY